MTTRRNRLRIYAAILILLGFTSADHAAAQQTLSGEIGAELRGFANEPAYDGQERHGVSAFFSPELFLEWADGSQRFVATPFVRLDADCLGRRVWQDANDAKQ